jgi:hypothetical protein
MTTNSPEYTKSYIERNHEKIKEYKRNYMREYRKRDISALTKDHGSYIDGRAWYSDDRFYMNRKTCNLF